MAIYPKFDAMLNRDLDIEERIEPLRQAVTHMKDDLLILRNRIANISEDVREDKLEELSDRIDEAQAALSDAAFFGLSSYTPKEKPKRREVYVVLKSVHEDGIYDDASCSIFNTMEEAQDFMRYQLDCLKKEWGYDEQLEERGIYFSECEENVAKLIMHSDECRWWIDEQWI